MLSEERSGSLSRGRRAFSIKTFLACSLVFIEVENLGVASSSFLDLPEDKVP